MSVDRRQLKKAERRKATKTSRRGISHEEDRCRKDNDGSRIRTGEKARQREKGRGSKLLISGAGLLVHGTLQLLMTVFCLRL